MMMAAAITTMAQWPLRQRPVVATTPDTVRSDTNRMIRPREPISVMTASGIPARNDTLVCMNSKSGAFQCAALCLAKRSK
jgi:hypothetical protein